MDEEIAKALKRIEDKLDLIIINTTKQKRKTPSKKIDTEQEALIDQILEMWKRLMKKPRVNINVETHRKPIRQRLSEGDYSYSDFEIVLRRKLKDDHFINNPQYYFPQTLYGSKFDKYLNADEAKKEVNYEERKIQQDEGFFADFNQVFNQ